ncbi:MAG: ARMT1-like domain-containing protein [Candidatus Omnitrophota bacterium]
MNKLFKKITNFILTTIFLIGQIQTVFADENLTPAYVSSDMGTGRSDVQKQVGKRMDPGAIANGELLGDLIAGSLPERISDSDVEVLSEDSPFVPLRKIALNAIEEAIHLYLKALGSEVLCSVKNKDNEWERAINAEKYMGNLKTELNGEVPDEVTVDDLGFEFPDFVGQVWSFTQGIIDSEEFKDKILAHYGKAGLTEYKKIINNLKKFRSNILSNGVIESLNEDVDKDIREKWEYVIGPYIGQNWFLNITNEHVDIFGKILDKKCEKDDEQMAEIKQYKQKFAQSKTAIVKGEINMPWRIPADYMYVKILEATRYWDNDIDPYFETKRDLAKKGASTFIKNVNIQELIKTETEGKKGLLKALDVMLDVVLFGNMHSDPTHKAKGNKSETYLINDKVKTIEYLLYLQKLTNEGKKTELHILHDNVGLELVSVFYYLDLCIRNNIVSKVVLHTKNYPYCVADVAGRKDIDLQLKVLEDAGGDVADLVQRIRRYIEEGKRIEVAKPHWFPTMGQNSVDIPRDYYNELKKADLIMAIGDFWYRKLFLHRNWDYTSDSGKILNYFPAPVLIVRMGKCPMLAGVLEKIYNFLKKIGLDKWWRTPKYGLINLIFPSKDHSMPKKTLIDPEYVPIAQKTLNNLFALHTKISQKLYLFLGEVRAPEDYRLGFNIYDEQNLDELKFAGLSLELIMRLYAISPEMLALYIAHECTPERDIVISAVSEQRDGRGAHRTIIKKLHEPVFGKQRTKGLGKILREFIDWKYEERKLYYNAYTETYFNPKKEERCYITIEFWALVNKGKYEDAHAEISQMDSIRKQGYSLLYMAKVQKERNHQEEFKKTHSEIEKLLRENLIKEKKLAYSLALYLVREKIQPSVYDASGYLTILVQPTLDTLFCMAVTQIEAGEFDAAKETIQKITEWVMGYDFASRFSQKKLYSARAKILASLACLRVYLGDESFEETFKKAIEEANRLADCVGAEQAETLSVIVKCMAQVELYDKALALTKSISDENFDSIENAFFYIVRAMYDFGYKNLAKKTLKESLNYMYGIAEKFSNNKDIQKTVNRWKEGETIGLAGVIVQAKYFQEINNISSEKIKALTERIIPEEKTEIEEVRYSAQLLQYNLKHFFAKHPGQKFYLGVDTEIEGCPGTDLTPNYQVLRKLSEIFPDLVLVEGDGKELADKINSETTGKYNNVGIVAKLANLDLFSMLQSMDDDTNQQVSPCIITIDDSGKEFEYLPILEAAAISIMMVFEATDQSILSFYNKISRVQISLKDLQAMLAKKIINILPKIKYGDQVKTLRARNEMVKRIYLSV